MPLSIAQLGQPVLRQVAAEVTHATIGSDEFRHFIDEMRATLEEAKGAGLAAPQVFASLRVFLAAILPGPDEESPPGVEVFINPRISKLPGDMVSAWEGCLSFPELLVKVPRHQHVRIDYLNERGEASTLDLEDFPARVVQHELDHLDGVLTIDRAQSTLHIIKASEAKEVLHEPEA
jgi:peptide deformylase